MNMYQIVDTKTDKVVEIGFDKREAAKPKRDELNGKKSENGEKLRYVIARGADHPRGETRGK